MRSLAMAREALDARKRCALSSVRSSLPGSGTGLSSAAFEPGARPLKRGDPVWQRGSLSQTQAQQRSADARSQQTAMTAYAQRPFEREAENYWDTSGWSLRGKNVRDANISAGERTKSAIDRRKKLWNIIKQKLGGSSATISQIIRRDFIQENVDNNGNLMKQVGKQGKRLAKNNVIENYIKEWLQKNKGKYGGRRKIRKTRRKSRRRRKQKGGRRKKTRRRSRRRKKGGQDDTSPTTDSPNIPDNQKPNSKDSNAEWLEKIKNLAN